MKQVTLLLSQWKNGDLVAKNSLIDCIYLELQKIAGDFLSSENHATELQPSSLVHEAYIRLIDLDNINWQDRAHFFAMAAKIMRNVLIDHSRKRNTSKRDGGIRMTLSGISNRQPEQKTEFIMIHNALEKLAEIDPERARLVELRFFGGLTIAETAEVLNLSPATVKRHWEVARGWLYKSLQDKT